MTVWYKATLEFLNASKDLADNAIESILASMTLIIPHDEGEDEHLQ